ncbi:serine/threonine-protein phosphatase [Glycomyces sp. L485]|uniref:PP2C family protein-serine/threonine phosphatase n=1 Tax=Glycomyces sp. L485 TaxID=2909235 RepID=UPI001F4AB628|nr:PP2C family protein-serine/threonine phosphatase [Glycomyces sp. L485]MCH7231934.1 serine/threonine-protein phosphatase [Glycomyces sp. L485]
MSPRVLREKPLSSGTRPPLWLQILPIVLFAALLAYQLNLPEPIRVGLVTAIVPMLAAFVLGPVAILAIGVTFTGLLAANLLEADVFSGRDIAAIGFVWATSACVAWLRQRIQTRLVTVEGVAEAVQHAILPELPGCVDELECAGFYRSAQRGALVGGDLFDLRASPFGPRLILGDVQGHGLSAVGTAATLLTAFHEAILDEPDLERVAARLERRLIIDAEQGRIPELFASILLVEFNEGASEACLLSYGHPPPLLVRSARVEEIGLRPSPLLGVRLETAEKPRVTRIGLRPGDTLLAYSDGVIDARDIDGNFYPLADRLAGLASPTSPERMVDFVWHDLKGFAHRMTDDISLIAVARGDGAS